MFDDQILSRRLDWEEARHLAGERFELVPDEDLPHPVQLEVVRVERREGAPNTVQFSIVFRGPVDPVYAQRMYRFRHARLGDYAILVTPVARTAAGTDYEACFAHVG